MTINDLPRFSKWPARLLGIEPWKQKVKSKEEIDREYETESWGVYLKRVKSEGLENSVTSHTLDDWQCASDTQVLYTKGNAFFQKTFGYAYSEYLNIIRGYIVKFLPAKSVVGLGCGYGSVILAIAEYLNEANFLAAEYTPSGIELTKICAKNQGIKIDVGHCDFMKVPITDLIVPKGAIIFTCAAACTLPKLPSSFIDSLIQLRPSVVIHFEPIYEHHNRNNLLDMMRRRYVEVNDYNRNLLTLLKESNIQILIEDYAVIGVNPLFPISVIAWKGV